MSWSKDMIFGAASAAYQVEGAYNSDGRGLSIWDALSDGHVKHGDNGNTACDEYHRFRDDIALMKKLNLQAYRFSVSWPRVIPKEGVVNEKGIRYYQNLVDEVLAQGMIPMVTLYHWDLPMWMHEKGGWYSDEIVDRFASYVEVVVSALSDRVKYWMTMNEAATFIGAGYVEGVHAPFETVSRDAENYEEKVSVLTKHVLLAHGRAVQIIRKKAKLQPVIGIAMDGKFFLPDSEEEKDIEHARQETYTEDVDCHRINWWLDPICKGTVNPVLQKKITAEEMEVIHQPIDFIGYNCYKANNFDDDNGRNPSVKPGMPRTAMGWNITPDALYWSVRFLHDRYDLPVLITENGMANIDFVMSDGKVHDPQRIEYMKMYLKGLKRVAEEGYPVMGYLYWSILDNFEWAEGYDKRFGLIYVDYETLERIPKDSALWFADYIRRESGHEAEV